jgi:hypothetical protein
VWIWRAGPPPSAMITISSGACVDFSHMDIEITIDDPKYYMRPYTFSAKFHLIPDNDVLEFVCAENEKDRVHGERQ